MPSLWPRIGIWLKLSCMLFSGSGYNSRIHHSLFKQTRVRRVERSFHTERSFKYQPNQKRQMLLYLITPQNIWKKECLDKHLYSKALNGWILWRFWRISCHFNILSQIIVSMVNPTIFQLVMKDQEYLLNYWQSAPLFWS